MRGLETGAVVAGYRVEGMVGRGGMGEVYRARQVQPDRLVALKVVTPQLAEDREFRERFRREAHAASSIEHPNVIPVYEVGEHEGLLFIAMRYVKGVDFKAMIGRGVPDRHVVRIVAQLGSALDAAHAHGLVHRDVKPANILVADIGGEPHAYLTDFGVTKHSEITDLTKPGSMIGSVDYIAPEQIRGEAVDGRTDVYSLTAVLYAALARRVPYPRQHEVATVHAHLEESPPSLLKARPDLPAPLAQVIRKGMAKDRRDRYRSAGDLGRAALAAFETASAPARPTKPRVARPEPPAGGPAAPVHDEPDKPTSDPVSPRVAALAERVGDFVARVARAVEDHERDELAGRLRDEVEEIGEREATVVVAGETGVGKSSLVNALLGRPGLSPVGPQLTTNVQIVFRRATREVARVYCEGSDAAREIPIDEIADHATVDAQPANPVQLIEVGLDHPLLARGLTIIDTPGVGGLDSSHGRITLAAVAGADVLLFLTDASAPLSRSEISFLRRATERIGTVVFVLTKRDLFGGWETIRRSDEAQLAKAPMSIAKPELLPVSSRAEIAAERARRAGEHEFAETLAAESGFDQLRARLEDRVLRDVELLRVRNALQLARNVLAELRLSDESGLAAGQGESQLRDALEVAAARRRQFDSSKRVGTVAVGDEFTLLGQDLNRELNRSLTALRATYEDMVKANKVKPQAVADSLDADLRAALATLDDTVRERLAALVARLAEELGVALPVAFDGLGAPPELAATPAGAGDHPDGLARVTGFMPSLFGAAAVPGIAGSIALILPAAAPLAPFAAAVGLSLVPLNIVQRRRAKSQQDAMRVVRESIERARIEVPPLLTKCLLMVRRRIEADLHSGIARREQELAAAVERQRRLADADSASQAAARKQAQAHLKQVHQLREEADALDQEAAECADAEHGRGRQAPAPGLAVAGQGPRERRADA